MSTIEFEESQFTGTTPDRTCIGVAPFDLDALVRRIARAHGATPTEVLGPRRTKHLCAARRELYVALRAIGWSYPAIGRYVSRDYSTVMNAVKPCPSKEACRARAKLRWATRGEP